MEIKMKCPIGRLVKFLKLRQDETVQCFPCCITIPMSQHQKEAGESKCTVIVLSLFVLLLANANLDHKLGNNVPKDWQSAGC